MPVITRKRLTWTPGRLQGLASAPETPGRLCKAQAWPASWESALLMICSRGVEWLALSPMHKSRPMDMLSEKNIDLLELYDHRRFLFHFSHPNRVFKNQLRLLTEEHRQPTEVSFPPSGGDKEESNFCAKRQPPNYRHSEGSRA